MASHFNALNLSSLSRYVLDDGWLVMFAVAVKMQ